MPLRESQNIEPPDRTNDELARLIIKRKAVSLTAMEMGAGTPISHTLSEQAGASQVWNETLAPNGKDRQERMGKPQSEKIRSISKEAVEEMLKYITRERKDLTYLVSSWQIPSNEPVDTHGWMALRHGEIPKEIYAHLTFDVGQSRMLAQQCVANAGLRLLLSEGNPTQIGNIFADQMFDGEGNSLLAEVLAQFEHLPEGSEHLILIDENGQLQRPMDHFREVNKKGIMPLYKGSFDPFTEAHDTIAEKAKSETGEEVIPLISVSNYTKGMVGVREILKRIKFLNGCGYKAMVCAGGTFVGNANMLKRRGVDARLMYLAGGDVATKLSYEDIKALKDQGHKVLLASRGNNKVQPDTELFRNLRTPDMSISSTQIRNREPGWEAGLPKRKDIDVMALYKKSYELEQE